MYSKIHSFQACTLQIYSLWPPSQLRRRTPRVSLCLIAVTSPYHQPLEIDLWILSVF